MKKRKFKYNGRKFESLDQWLDYLKSGNDEQNRILAAMQRRPLRKGEMFDRRTELIDGVGHWVSKVIRADGSIEVWARRFVDEDDSYSLTTHVGYSLIAHFVSVEPDL